MYGDNNITDKDVPQIYDIIINNKTLKVLYLTNCPNITEYGIQQIPNVLVYKNGLCELFVNGNYLWFYFFTIVLIFFILVIFFI